MEMYNGGKSTEGGRNELILIRIVDKQKWKKLEKKRETKRKNERELNSHNITKLATQLATTDDSDIIRFYTRCVMVIIT